MRFTLPCETTKNISKIYEIELTETSDWVRKDSDHWKIGNESVLGLLQLPACKSVADGQQHNISKNEAYRDKYLFKILKHQKLIFWWA